VTVRKLPPKDSPEGQKVIERYLAGERATLVAELGYSSRGALNTAMSRTYGLRVSEQPWVGKVTTSTGLTELELQVLELVGTEAVSVGEISRRVDRSAETVIKTIDALRSKSYEVVLDEISRQVSIPQEPTKEFKPTEFKYFRKFYRIGLVSDTQMGSKYQQVTLLHDAYADFDKRQVDFVLHAGDVTDGRDMYRGQLEETFLHGADEQKDYVVKSFPHLARGRRTYMIGGQHDRSFYRDKGYNIIRAICQERKDLVDRGFYKAEFSVKGLKVGLQHPGGGVAYARSYRMQKIIEGMMGFINTIPAANAPVLQIFGHWHIPCHLPAYMGIDAVSLPCFQSQTPYLEQHGLMPMVGYAVAEISLDKDDNLTSTKIEFIVLNAQIKEKDY